MTFFWSSNYFTEGDHFLLFVQRETKISRWGGGGGGGGGRGGAISQYHKPFQGFWEQGKRAFISRGAKAKF